MDKSLFNDYTFSVRCKMLDQLQSSVKRWEQVFAEAFERAEGQTNVKHSEPTLADYYRASLRHNAERSEGRANNNLRRSGFRTHRDSKFEG